MSAELQPLAYWYGIDGTTYALVHPDQVGDRRRWWIPRVLVPEYQAILERGFGRLPIGPTNPSSLHARPMGERRSGDGEIVLALIIPDREPGPSEVQLAALIDAALADTTRKVIEPGKIGEWIAGIRTDEADEP